jgi:hypothetical protein
MNDAIISQLLAAMSEWVNAGEKNAARDPEALDLVRLGKISEENGEMWEAWNSVAGANPRKEPEFTMEDVLTEALDVATSALGVYEHFTGNRGDSWHALKKHVVSRSQRVGIFR